MWTLKCSRANMIGGGEEENRKSVLVYLIFTLLMVFLLFQKVGYNIDELLSYGLANQTSGQPWFEDGVNYTPSQTPWLSYFTVQKGAAFDLRSVWANQTSDNHPPFYYLILHIICFLFPGKFSKWFAGSINIVFALLTLYIVRKLVYELTDSWNMVRVISLFYILSGGILYTVLFLRMYVMTTFLFSLATWLFIHATVFEKLSWRFYASLILVSYIGMLTHYYFILYLFFLCLVFGIWLLFQKRYLEMMLFAISLGFSGILAVATFRSIIWHILLSGRGVESLENMKGSLPDYLKRLVSFYQFINGRLFGGILTYVIIASIFICIFYKWVVRKNTCKVTDEETDGSDTIQQKGRTIKWLLMLVPSISYFLLVSKIAVYIDARYLSPAYSVFMVWILCGIFVMGKRIVEKRYLIPASGLLLAVMTVNSWRVCSGDLMYKDVKEISSRAEEYALCNCLYIYDVDWRTTLSFLEVPYYKSVTFYKDNNLESLADMQDLSDTEMVVCIAGDSDPQEILNYIMEVCPSLNAYQEIHSFVYTTSYYLYEDSQTLDSGIINTQTFASVEFQSYA